MEIAIGAIQWNPDILYPDYLYFRLIHTKQVVRIVLICEINGFNKITKFLQSQRGILGILLL